MYIYINTYLNVSTYQYLPTKTLNVPTYKYNCLKMAKYGYFCQFLQFFRETDGLSISNPYTLLISIKFRII